MEEKEDLQPKRQPAITISIQSWATPIVGVVMLIIGLLGGYYYEGPSIRSAEEQAAVPRINAPAQAEGTGTGNEKMMAYLVSQTRHFKGDPNAPVTLIEFGDFQ